MLKLFRPYSATKEATLRLLNNWDIFGHLAFEGETKQRAYAEAVTECRVTKAPKIFVERAIKRDPRVAFKMLTLSELRLVQYEELVKCLLPRETEVRVANLWVNRLIGDAQPGARKVAFVVAPTYKADAPLRPSGLIGPVRLDAEAR